MILVTGATGFVGSHLIESLLGMEPLRALVRPETDASALEAAGVEIVRGDLRDPGAGRRAVEGCRVVHPLAALTSHSGASARDLFETNVEGTAGLAAAGLNAQRSRSPAVRSRRSAVSSSSSATACSTSPAPGAS